MNIIIIESAKSRYGTYYTLRSGTVEALIVIKDPGIQVICKNASHRVWKGSGRYFPTTEAALANYKSSEMRAMIEFAVKEAV